MFELINNIRSEFAGNTFNLPPIPERSRQTIIADVVKRLYDKAAPGNQKNISVYLNNTHEFFAFESSSLPPTLCVPVLLFIKSAEIPKQFQFTKIDDPLLDDKNLLKEYSNWLCSSLNIKPLNSTLSKETIQLTLALMKDEQKAQAALKLILMHELGHIYNSDSHFYEDWLLKSKILSISWPISAALLIKGPLLPSIFWIVIAASISFFALKIILYIPIGRFIENRADAFACQHCPDAIEGGIYFFQIMMQHNQRMRKEALEKVDRQEAECSGTFTLWIIANKCWNAIRKCWIKTATSVEGDSLCITHPSDATRIANFRHFQKPLTVKG